MRILMASLLLFSCFHLPLTSNSSIIIGNGSHSSSDVEERAPSNAVRLLNLSSGSVELHPYGWSYMRVELPSSYLLASISVQSSVDDEVKGISSRERERLPMMCLRNGGPPIPDVLRTALNGLVLTQPSEGLNYLQDPTDQYQCYHLGRNLSFILTYDKVPPGTYYLGFFNGLGLQRNEAKSRKKGSAYSFRANVTAHGCKRASGFLGGSCNLRVDHLSSAAAVSCHSSREPKFYSLNVVQVAQQLKLGLKSPNGKTGNHSIMSYARLNALPGNNNGSHDYSVEISREPLVIQLPKVGTWYLKLQPLRPYQGKEDESESVCYSLDWEVKVCSNGMAGPHCSSRAQVLKGFHLGLRNMPYVASPDGTKNKTFMLRPANSTSTASGSSDSAWTYYIFNTSKGTAGKNMHILVDLRAGIDIDMYVRYSGMPSADLWDYCYRNQKAMGKNNNTMFKLYEAEGIINLYLLYPKEGEWTVGLVHKNVGSNNYSDDNNKSEILVSIESCPIQCSGYGTCLDQMDASGQGVSYSYCSCDLDHGGLDCSEDTVPPQVKLLRDFCLIFSNLAALLPGLWSLRIHAYSEAAIFLASGAASAIYHSCDVSLWCFLRYNVVQFLDFWLSFMSIITTFLYIPTIPDSVKGPIRVVAAIITATLTVIGPTRPVNVIVTFALGAICLVLGWLVQYFTLHHMGRRPSLQEDERRPILRVMVKMVTKGVRWDFVGLGFVFLVLAGGSKKMETVPSYWIWHSLWHLSIYVSAFFFLCCKLQTTSENDNVPGRGCSSCTSSGNG